MLLTVVITLCCFPIAIGESSSQTIPFEGVFSKTIENTDVAFLNSQTRALSTVCIAFDIILSLEKGSPLEPDLTATSFIVHKGEDIILVFHTKNGKTISVGYAPDVDIGVYSEDDERSDNDIELALKLAFSGNVFKNDIVDIITIVVDLSDKLSY